MPRALIVNGYHGTTSSNVENILTKGFLPSTNSYDWLGHGIYFWQDAPMRAREWVEESKARGIEKPVVIKARLKLSNCVDLLDVGWRDLIARSATKFLSSRDRSVRRGTLFNSTTGRHNLDCAFFNFLVRWLSQRNFEVGAIRAAVGEGDQILPGSPIRLKSHVQIAILNPALISKRIVVS
jgi:hypothetical protein